MISLKMTNEIVRALEGSISVSHAFNHSDEFPLTVWFDVML